MSLLVEKRGQEKIVQKRKSYGFFSSYFNSEEPKLQRVKEEIQLDLASDGVGNQAKQIARKGGATTRKESRRKARGKKGEKYPQLRVESTAREIGTISMRGGWAHDSQEMGKRRAKRRWNYLEGRKKSMGLRILKVRVHRPGGEGDNRGSHGQRARGKKERSLTEVIF